MTDAYPVCPVCGHAEAADERADCPECGSGRTYLNHARAWPDATGEACVKLDAEDAEERGRRRGGRRVSAVRAARRRPGRR